MTDDYDTIRQRAEERVKKRESAKEDLIAYIVINVVLWITWLIGANTSPQSDIVTMAFFGLLLTSVIWGIIAAVQFIEVMFLEPGREQRLERQVEQEMQRELKRNTSLIPEKPKRLILSDDGEVIFETDNERQQLDYGG